MTHFFLRGRRAEGTGQSPIRCANSEQAILNMLGREGSFLGDASDEAQWPSVSVVMPVRNETLHIRRSIAAVLAQDYSAGKIEIIVADGGSTDGTRSILQELALDHPSITIVDNPGQIVATGLNIALSRARGEIVIRVDGHGEVASDFVRQAVVLLRAHPEAWAAGGPIVHSGRNPFGRATAIAMSHPVGVGMASHRFSGYEGYAEGTAFPAIRRWVFNRIGNFDEQLVRNQDDEFNYRIARAGGKFYVSPSVRYVYYVRDSPGKLFRQYLQYGFWRVPIIRKHKRPTTKRQLVPPLFLLLLLILTITGVLAENLWIALSLPVGYLTALLHLGLTALPLVGFKVAVLVPVAVATMHVAYGLGFGYGLFRALLPRQTWHRSGSMSVLSR